MEDELYYIDDKRIYNYKLIENDDYEPNKECTSCDVEYTCWDCEAEQIRERYPEARYTDHLEWIVPMKKEINYKNYKMKRPKEGYNSEEERAFNKWSGVSDYDLFFKDKPIGHIYYVGSSLVEWAGYLVVENGKHEKAFPCVTRKEVFEQLCRNHHDRKGKSDADR